MLLILTIHFESSLLPTLHPSNTHEILLYIFFHSVLYNISRLGVLFRGTLRQILLGALVADASFLRHSLDLRDRAAEELPTEKGLWTYSGFKRV